MVLGLDAEDMALADDLDHAVALFGRHVEAEIDKAVNALQGTGKKPKNVTPERAREAAKAVVARLVDRVIRFEFADVRKTKDSEGGAKAGASYTVEKPITGDPMVDKHAFTGRHTIIKADGTRQEFDGDVRLS